MKARIQRMCVWGTLVAVGFAFAWLILPPVQGQAQFEKPLAAGLVKWNNKGVKTPAKPAEGKPEPNKDNKLVAVVKEQVRGGIVFPAEKRMWTRITGKVTVLDAYTLRFADGTEVCLSGAIDAPELEQKGLIGDSFYPCGKEAAEFLKKLIGDQPVSFLGDRAERVGKKMAGSCFVGETNLEIEMVRNGWAFSHHSGMDAWEIIARENTRGLWRGQFVVPERWRKGERLKGE